MHHHIHVLTTGGKRNKKNGKGKGKEGNIAGGNEKIAASQPDLDKDMDSCEFSLLIFRSLE